MGKAEDLSPQQSTNVVEKDSSGEQKKISRRTFLSNTRDTALTVAAIGLLTNCSTATNNKSLASQETTPAPSFSKNPSKYQHLLSRFQLGNHILKNRIVATTGTSPHLIMGTQNGPNEAYIIHTANTARAGASIVILSQPIFVHAENDDDVVKIREGNPNPANPDHGTDRGHFPNWELASGGAQNLMSQLTEGVHFYGSLCMWKANLRPPRGYDVSGGIANEIGSASVMMQEIMGIGNTGPAQKPKKELSVEMLRQWIEEVTLQCALGKECGFDGVWLHAGYRGSPAARMLSPAINRRTDQYGGSHKNRARLAIELAEAIKKRCGKDFVIMLMMSGEEPEGGYTLDDGAKYAKLFSDCGYIDMLDVKADGGSANAPDNFLTDSDKHTPNLYMTEYYKKKGVTIPLLSDGGFTDLELSEQAIAEGKTDVVGMCRGLIANRNMIDLAIEGRNEDVVPCIRCNACHGGNYFVPWTSTCAVNPLWGIEHKVERMITPPEVKKKIAVIGGGTAGMKAALVAAERGHSVTLYEKTGALGGNFKLIENVTFRWPNKEFKNYLVRQIGKSKVTVFLNSEATPSEIKKKGYDAVLVAIGQEPVVPDIPGINGENVVFAPEIYGNEAALAHNVVIIGGFERATEAALHLEEKGHHVIQLAETEVLAPDAMRVHYYDPLMDFIEKHKNYSFVTNACCTGITKSGVTYKDADGKQHLAQADSVVIAMGMKPDIRKAESFSGFSTWFHRIGTCGSATDLQTSIRDAFSTASLL